MVDNLQGFLDAMHSTGITPPEYIEPGTFHRFPGIGKPNGNKSGWCQLFPDTMGGIYGDHSTGLSESWQAERGQPLTEA
jgi:putative DNA primase/helicase